MTDEITKQITAFLESDTDKILILKGKWGVGKTYFWQQFINDHIHDYHSTFQTYSYVSLFGINSLETFQETIITNSLAIKKPIPKDSFIQWCIEEKEWWSSRLPGKIYRKLISMYQKIITSSHGRHALRIHPLLNKLPISLRKIDSPLNKFLYNQIINNNIICIDDIERSNLPIITLMGYADKLTQKKNCKIIFIFNEDELELNQKIIFNQYREKIVDVELTYSPTLEDQLKIAFGDDLLEKYPIIREVINSKSGQGFHIKNIRILKKIKHVINNFEESNTSIIPTLILDDFIKHVIFLSHCYYELNNDNNIPFFLIKDQELGINLIEKYEIPSSMSLIQYPNKEPDEKSKQENTKYNEDCYQIIKNTRRYLGISYPSIFSDIIIHKIEYGYWNQDELQIKIQQEIRRIDFLQRENVAKQNIAKAWGLYKNTYHDNLDNIIRAFEEIIMLPENYQNLSLLDFLSNFDNYYFYKKMQNKDIQKQFNAIDTYIQYHKNTLINHKTRDVFMYNLNADTTQYTKNKIKEIEQEQLSKSFEGFISNLPYEYVSNSDRQYLNTITEDEYYYWIMSKENDPELYFNIAKIIDIKNGLNNIIPLKNALIRIGKNPQLNRELTKDRLFNAYKLDIDEY